MLRMQDPQLQQLLAHLAQVKEFAFLDTSRPDEENDRSLLFLNPRERLRCLAGDDPQDYLRALQHRLAAGHYLVGWVAYEFGALLEAGLPPRQGDSPLGAVVLADLGVYDQPRIFDHRTGDSDFPCIPAPLGSDEGYRLDNLHPNMTEEEFVAALEAVHDYIGAGDSYQVNYTMKLLFDFAGSPEALYGDLRRNQSVGYGAYLRHGEERILSFSPELFFRKSGASITARPMKGTMVRGRNVKEERERMRELHEDGKNRSENVMIVDLLRNDLSRLLHGHGQSRVYVQSLFDVEPYESLLQMTSTVKAVAGPEVMGSLKLTEIFRALFPCGSITGAPKIRTMEIINELEVGPRGVYTGAIGYFAPDGSAAFNVPIRTLRLVGERGEMGVGAGITYDSDPREEWQESLLKGRFLTHRQPQFQLFETILWREDTGYYLLDQHLRRLGEAAMFFKFTCDVAEIEGLLAVAARDFPGACQRVRVSLHKDGRVEITAVAIPPPARLVLPSLPETVHNLIIFRQGGYVTPPVGCGLLPGVMRESLLAAGAPPLVEMILSEQEVRSAEAVYLCNSVRGVVRVEVL